ncbi:ASCH domain-containing protein [Moritella sp. 24]|uniref:ASCH domain-containing protein n=1 Tax=Moritella sp. 24 TaxID=2746230 RepID=UPI001BAE0B37|nr:ASCH domain-containing protein [Moritella sp. 24]QUM77146.1 ASCH domain-containing protein [Moritella sp. 24]
MEQKTQDYLNNYLDTLTDSERKRYTSFSADYFCGDEINANLCADLVSQGIKTATSSMKHWYDSGEEMMPTEGHLLVVTNWDGEPQSIVEITAVSECKYSDVTAEFACSEGEGDRTLDWWRAAHWDFFSNECVAADIEADENMVLVLEHFQVVHGAAA